MDRLGFDTKLTKFELAGRILAQPDATLPGGWQVTVESEPYYKKRRPTALLLQKGLYRPWFEVICEDGHLALVFHDSLPARLICWAAAALALGVMAAARALWPDGPAAWGYWVPGALALALLLWDFTRPGRVQAAVTRFVRGTLLGGEGR